METHQNIIYNIRRIPVQEACVLYTVNIKDDYEKHLVFYKFNSAKHMKKHIVSKFQLDGTGVYIQKVLGFYDNENSIHGLNGFKYTLSSIENNEINFRNKNIDGLLSHFSL